VNQIFHPLSLVKVKEILVRSFLKWLGICIGSLVGLILVAGLGATIKANIQLTKNYSTQVETITISNDSASIARGKQWVESGNCIYCHGYDLAGTAFLDDPLIGSIPARNLTPGFGGAGREFTDADWVRAIRHGINPDGRSLIIMPSNDFYHFSDRDLGDIIAYLKSLPAVDKEWHEPEFAPFGKILVGAGAFGGVLIADNIDHTAARPSAPMEGPTAEYGEYLVKVKGCRMCHGENLAGDKNPPNPDAPPVPGILAGSEVAFWSETDFFRTIRTGSTPSGHHMTKFMPWKQFSKMSDDNLKAIWLYLKSITKN
jgi:mono/diheme cytochrome c family protein